MRDSFFKSEREATPVTSDERTRGIAMNFSRFIKIVPNGEIQSDVNLLQPFEAAKTPKIIPSTKPIIIFQCSFIGRYEI